MTDAEKEAVVKALKLRFQHAFRDFNDSLTGRCEEDEALFYRGRMDAVLTVMQDVLHALGYSREEEDRLYCAWTKEASDEAGEE